MTLTSSRGRLLVAVMLAVLLHAPLFFLVTPSLNSGLGGIPVSPKTSFLGQTARTISMAGSDPRVVESPVLFSLPSGMGFSRALMEQDVSTRLLFQQQTKSEQFLDAELNTADAAFDSLELMLSAGQSYSPKVPADIFQTSEARPSARRVTLAPELKERIVGGVVLPAELNKEASKAWEAQAEISVSERGFVKHVFLKQPLETPELNLQILRLLYSLQFNEGEPVDGLVEIYSPETKAPVEEAAP